MLNWLMQRTADGATYMQVIILVVLMIALSVVGINTWNDIIKTLKEGCEDDEIE